MAGVLEEMPPLPTPKWVMFQFQPSHPHNNIATRYTGRFNLVMKVQVVLLLSQSSCAHLKP